MLEKEGDEKAERSIIRYQNFSFREIVGSFLYLCNNTRPNIAVATSHFSRKQENLLIKNLEDIKRVLSYLKRSSNEGLEYSGKGNGIERFVDASFTSDKTDRKSTTGFIVKFWGDTMS